MRLRWFGVLDAQGTHDDEAVAPYLLILVLQAGKLLNVVIFAIADHAGALG